MTSVTRNFQVTLTKDVREALVISEGSRFFVDVEGDEIRLKLIKRSPVDDSFGIFGKGESGAKTIRKIRDESEKRVKRLWGEPVE